MSLEEAPVPSVSAANTQEGEGEQAMETNDAEVNPPPHLDSPMEAVGSVADRDREKRALYLLKALYPESFVSEIRESSRRNRSVSMINLNKCGDCTKRYDDVVRRVHKELLSGRLTMVGVTRTPNTHNKKVQVSLQVGRDMEDIRENGLPTRRLRDFSVGRSARAHRISTRSGPYDRSRSRRGRTPRGYNASSDDAPSNNTAPTGNAPRGANASTGHNALRSNNTLPDNSGAYNGLLPFRGIRALMDELDPRADNVARGDHASRREKSASPARAANAGRDNVAGGLNATSIPTDNDVGDDTPRSNVPSDKVPMDEDPRNSTSSSDDEDVSIIEASMDNFVRENANNPSDDTPIENGSEEDISSDDTTTPRHNNLQVDDLGDNGSGDNVFTNNSSSPNTSSRANASASIARENSLRGALRDSVPRNYTPRNNGSWNTTPPRNNSSRVVSHDSDTETLTVSVPNTDKRCFCDTGFVRGASGANPCRFGYPDTLCGFVGMYMTEGGRVQRCTGAVPYYGNQIPGPSRRHLSRQRHMPYGRSRSIPTLCEDDAIRDLHMHVLDEDARNPRMAYVDILENLHRQGPCRNFCLIKADIARLRQKFHRMLSSQMRMRETGTQVQMNREGGEQSVQMIMKSDVGIQTGDGLAQIKRTNGACKKDAFTQVNMTEPMPDVEKPVSHVTGVVKLTR